MTKWNTWAEWFFGHLPSYPSDTICWEWSRSNLNRDGYPLAKRIGVSPSTRRINRVAWEAYNGPIPEGLLVRHTCDNRLCVNPRHLCLGTPADNMRDKMQRGRQHFPGPTQPARGERHGMAKLTQAQVDEIRSLHASTLHLRRYDPERWNQYRLAERYGVDRRTIQFILSGKHWRT